MPDASEHSANEHDRLREAIGSIQAEARETRNAMYGLKDAILSKWAELERSIMAHTMRLDAHDKALEESKAASEKANGRRERNVAERVNLAINALLSVGVALLLWKVFGVK